MDPFSYLAVLISIILGLGITHLLSGLGSLLQDRDRIRLYWPGLVWVGVLLLLHVQTWWAMFGLSALRTWTFSAFALVLLQPIVLFLLAALVLPQARAESARDLRIDYYAHSGWFFGLAVALLIVSLARDLVLSGGLPGRLNTAAHVVLFFGWGLAAITRRESYHKSLAVLTALLIVAYIAVLFRDLP